MSSPEAQASDRVLVVDDEPPILRALATNLRARGYAVDLAATGEEALRLAAQHRPDVVILDLGLPGISGVEVLDGLRGWSTKPIIVLSARGAEQDKVAALDAGADGEVRLTPIEWGLVETLVRNAGKLVSQRQLLQEVWGPATARRPTTCGSTWPTSAASWNRSRRSPATSSPSPAWASASRTPADPAC